MNIDETHALAKVYATGLRPSGIETDIGFDESGCYLQFCHVASGKQYKFYSESEVIAFTNGTIVGLQMANATLRAGLHV